jgi:hypothetical protein
MQLRVLDMTITIGTGYVEIHGDLNGATKGESSFAIRSYVWLKDGMLFMTVTSIFPMLAMRISSHDTTLYLITVFYGNTSTTMTI